MAKKFEIPSAPVEPVSKEPKTMIIYSAPKIGKTTIVSMLKNSLIMEHEPNGAAALKARYVQLNNPYDIEEFVNFIKEDKKTLDTIDFIIIDTITKWDRKNWLFSIFVVLLLHEIQHLLFNFRFR